MDKVLEKHYSSTLTKEETEKLKSTIIYYRNWAVVKTFQEDSFAGEFHQIFRKYQRYTNVSRKKKNECFSTHIKVSITWTTKSDKHIIGKKL